MAKKEAIIILAITLAILANSASAITSCGNVSNSVSLENDVNAVGTCFTIDKSNIVLNGNGFKVTGDGSGTFAIALNLNNITIKDFNVDGFVNGVVFSNVNTGSLLYNNLTLNSTSSIGAKGISLANSQLNNISSNIIKVNGFGSGFSISGIYIHTSSNNTFLSNKINVTGSSGTTPTGIITFSKSLKNKIISNEIFTYFGGEGINIGAGADETVLSYNQLNISPGFNAGIKITSNNNSVFYNTVIIEGSSGSGMKIGGTNNTISNNLINSTSADPKISLDTATHSRVISNKLFSNRNSANYALSILNGKNNTVSSNVITGIASFSGIVLQSSNNNTIQLNNISGIGESGQGEISLISSKENVIISNIINSSQDGHGIVINSGSTKNNITSNQITTDGTSSYGIYLSTSNKNNIQFNKVNTTSSHGILIDAPSFDNNLLFNTITVTGNLIDGIKLKGSVNLVSNYVETKGTSSAAINIISPSTNSTLFNNSLLTNNTNSYGIKLESVVNTTILSSLIITKGYSGYGFYILNSLNNTFLYNLVNTSGAGADSMKMIDSSYNNLSSNYFETKSVSAIGINILGNSTNNTFFNNTIQQFNTTSPVQNPNPQLNNTSIYNQTVYSTGLFVGYPTIEIDFGGVKSLSYIDGSTCYNHKRTGRLYQFQFRAMQNNSLVYSQILGPFGGITRGRLLCDMVTYLFFPKGINADKVIFEGQWVKGTPNAISTNFNVYLQSTPQPSPTPTPTPTPTPSPSPTPTPTSQFNLTTFTTGVFASYPTIDVNLNGAKTVFEIAGKTCYSHKRTGRLYQFNIRAKLNNSIVYSTAIGPFGGLTKGRTRCDSIYFDLPNGVIADKVTFDGMPVKGTPNPVETNFIVRTV